MPAASRSRQATARVKNAKRSPSRSRSRSPMAPKRLPSKGGAAKGAAAGAASCCPTGLISPYTSVGPFLEAVPVVIQLAKAAVLLAGLALAGSAALDAAAPHTAAAWDTAASLAAETRLGWWDVSLGLAATLALGAYRRAAAVERHAAESRRSGAPGGFGQHRRVVVIGAGPSGLVAAKFLRDAGHEVRIIEGESDLGGTFRYRAYDHAVHVSSKYLTAFTDLRLDAEEEDHLPITRYLDYLDEYAKMFSLRPLVEFHTWVSDVTRRTPAQRSKGMAEYAVTISRKKAGNGFAPEEVIEADAVVVCSGLHLSPLKQHIPGIESFKGQVIHSVDYKHRSQLRRKKLLISGSGETAMDIAYHAICPGGDEADAITLSTKNGFLSVPSCLPGGLPLDIFINNLFEVCYEHRWVERFHLKWMVATFGIRGSFWVFSGSSKGYNQWAAAKAEVKRGYHFINKSGRAMSAVNAAAKGSISAFPWNLSQPACHRPVRLVGQVTSHKGNGTFRTACGSTVSDVDMLVQATGYRQVFPFLRKSRTLDERGDHPLPTERLIVDEDEPHMCFLGFARPNVGAIPPLAEMQIMWWLQYVQGDISLPLRSPSYKLLAKTSKKVVGYGVDHGAYMHQLGRDINAAPSLYFLATEVGPKALIAYTLGQSFTSMFRMCGPFADAHSTHVTSTELYETITRRGLLVNLMFAKIAVTFGVLNVACLVLDLLLCAVGVYVLPFESGHLM